LIVPGVICIGVVYFLHFGIAMGMGLYYVGSAVGLFNILMPLVKHQENKPKFIEMTMTQTRVEKNIRRTNIASIRMGNLESGRVIIFWRLLIYHL
jgi:hypothetical protein